MLAVLVLLLAASAPAPPTLKVALTADPAVVRIDDADVPLAKVAETIEAAGKAVTTLALAEGAAVPAHAAVAIIDRCAKGGRPVRAVFPPSKTAPTFERGRLDRKDWVDGAPTTDDACAGALPQHSAVNGFSPLLEVDLRGIAALSGTGKTRTLRSHPATLLDGALPGEPGPSAAVGLSVGADSTAADLFAALRFFSEKGAGRVLLLLKNGPDTAGIIVSLSADSERAAPLTRRAKPPTDKGLPAYRAMRLLCEEALVALRQSQRPDGTVPGDSDFTDAEATALTLMAFIGAGVRAGDGTKNGAAVLAMTRYVNGWPYDKERHPRRERSIIAAAVLETAARTRHPLLVERGERAVAEIAKELASDSQIREGIDKGFEAIALRAANTLELGGTADACAKLHALLDATVDADGKVLNNWSTRNSQESLAFAYAYLAFGWANATNPRVAALAAQAPPEFPATDSSIPNVGRPIGLFFQSRVAQLAGEKIWDTFDLGLKSSLPKTAPKSDLDFEARTPDQVVCPWSGGSAVQSAGRVALMVMVYSSPEEKAVLRKR